MAINIEMNIKGSNDQYQTVYPQTTTDNVIGLNTELSNLESQFNQALTNYFTKDQTLQDNTATMFRLNVDAVPDDVFAYLGKYAQYWWRRRTYTPYKINFGPLEDQPVLWRSGSTNIWSVSYSPEINVFRNFATLKNPLTLSVSYSEYNNANQLKGNYFILYDSEEIAYVSPDAPNATKNYNNGTYSVYIQGKKIESITPAEVGETWEYLQSSDRSAYPDSGEQDGYEYEYLGIPFENAVDALKIETGSYVGTGTYGESNPNTLTFGFVPKFVVIMNAGTSDNAFMLLPNSWGVSKGYICPEVTTQSFGDSIDYVFSGNSVSWYSNEHTGSQANGAGGVYGYFAIG